MKSFEPLRVNHQLVIPPSELRFSFVRSSGPGGQNVNKVNSKAQLRWSVAKSQALSEEVRVRIRARLARRLSDRGEIVVVSQRYRDQARNVGDCLTKLRDLLAVAAAPPKRRKKTRPPKSASESRLRDKKAKAEKKRGRARPADD
jgi:ribosome-associated protein